MKILALDPASRCGFAHSEGHYGAWSLVGKGKEHAGARLVQLRDYLNDVRQRWGVDQIAFEDASFGSPNPRVQAGHNELRGVIKLFCAEHAIPLVSYHPTSIKKFATGSGRADKAQMIAACQSRLNIEVTDDNMADALWILEMAKSEYVPPSQQKKQQQKAKRKKQPKLF